MQPAVAAALVIRENSTPAVAAEIESSKADLVAESAAEDGRADGVRTRAAAVAEQQALISAQTDLLRTTAACLAEVSPPRGHWR